MTHSIDPYGLKVSATGAAFDCWLQGLEMSLSFDHSGIPELKRALEINQGFALAHLTLARQLTIHGLPIEGMRHLKKAVALKAQVTAREASLIGVTEAALEFHPDAKDRSLAHLENWPTDVAAFSYLVGPFGQLAFSGDMNWRQANIELLNRHQKHWSDDDWWYLTTRGFMLSETGELTASEKTATRAYALKPNGNCAHTVSHLQLEQGAFDEGRSFLKNWMCNDGKGSDMHHHFHWHTAIIGFETGSTTTDTMAALYKEALDPSKSDPMPLTTFSDNASLLWRCHLHDHSMPENYVQDMWDYAQKHYPYAGFIFADIHKIMLAALSPNNELYSKLKSDFQSLGNSKTGTLLCQLNEAFREFSQSKFADCADTLRPLIQKSVLLGGSNPQRKIIEETYVAASKRAGHGG